MGKDSSKKPLLKEAIKDINRELTLLKNGRADFKRQISNIDLGVYNSRNMEEQLKKKIAKLLEKEAKLNKKKSSTQDKIDRLSDKLNKIEKIKSEISDI